MTDLDTLAINTIRFLAVDAIQKANSGHPGLPMGAAPMAYALWTRFLRHNPANPHWPNRDRFVLSGGHGSMLLYALLHLTGYDLTLNDLKQFRQWNSRTPGHPERHLTPGVEVTTGPLGQGLANAVGLAVAEAHLAARYNRPGHTPIDHYTYVLASDGDLMEGVAFEACALAGHWRLGKLIVLYDDNHISLAGTTSLSFSEDVGARFTALGWHTLNVSDGNDIEAITRAIQSARAFGDRPSLIAVRTQIGYGAPTKQGTAEAHGSPLGAAEVRAAKERLHWPLEPDFHIPAEVTVHFRQALSKGAAAEADWHTRWQAYQAEFPELAAELGRRLAGDLPTDWQSVIPTFPADPKGLATRKASETVLQHLAAALPELVGGSADLNPSTFTVLKNHGDFQSVLQPADFAQGRSGGDWSYAGRNLHFGVREHGMGAIVNGLAAHGGFIPYGATFLVFSDYMRPTLRLAAIMELGSVWVFTHDSIGVGEDGPTHQPVEHYAALRAIPGALFIRPADANETAHAWRVALANRHRPTMLALTRQNLPILDRAVLASAEGVERGAYILKAVAEPQLVIIATGSEVSLMLEAEKLLAAHGVRAQLVSMPCWELFAEQPADYQRQVLPPHLPRLAVEAGVAQGWERWATATVTLNRYGASAPAPRLLAEFGFTAEHVAQQALSLLP